MFALRKFGGKYYGSGKAVIAVKRTLRVQCSNAEI
jgi:hypothetical protein